MDDIQQEYRDQLASIVSLKASSKTKTLLLENLANTVREWQSQSQSNLAQHSKYKGSSEALSTSISECYSMNYANEKDVQQLEDKIIKMRMVKFENNEEIQTMEEELFEMEKIVKARMEYHDYLKKQVDMKMLKIQRSDEKEK